jgi:cell cycle arrest protein BUB3
MASENERPLASPPSDGVTACRWTADGATLLVSSWDASLSLHAASPSAPAARLWRTELPQPVLECDSLASTGSATTAVSACLDGVVRLHDISTSSTRELGRHASAARCVRACPAAGAACLVSGSWDGSLKLWDVRASEPCVGSYEQPDKVLSLCCGAAGSAAARAGSPIIAVATAARHVVLLDVRAPSEALQRRESSLKSATRCIAMSADASGFTLGSVDGRVAVEIVDPSPEAQAKRYAFRCHRSLEGGVDTAHPVNAIAVHPVHATFATGGGDGHVYVWDVRARTLTPRPCVPPPATARRFSLAHPRTRSPLAHPPASSLVRHPPPGARAREASNGPRLLLTWPPTTPVVLPR